MDPDTSQPSDPRALAPAIYDELRRIATSCLREERANHTLQPTALVHEAFLKLADTPDPLFNDQTHFRIVASTAMRQILVDHARARATQKRGGDGRWLQITLDAALPGAASDAVQVIDLLALDEALTSLAAHDERKSRVVELRFFGGLSIAEIASCLGVSKRTAESDWYMARAWLRRQLNGEERSSS